MSFLHTCEQMLLVDENIGVRERLKDCWTPHVIRSTVMPGFCKSELVWQLKLQPLLNHRKFFMKCFFCTKFYDAFYSRF